MTNYPGKSAYRRQWLDAVESGLADAIGAAQDCGDVNLVERIEAALAEAAAIRKGLDK